MLYYIPVTNGYGCLLTKDLSIDQGNYFATATAHDSNGKFVTDERGTFLHEYTQYTIFPKS